MPPFFVPHVPAEKHEQVYEDLAKACGRRALPKGSRIYSISYRHNGEEWTATVGEQLRGSRSVTRGRGRTKVERDIPLSDASVVLAIFADAPFLVWHDGASTAWANPFMAGVPKSVIKFSD